MDLVKYKDIIIDLKEKFKTHQIKASIKVNSELLEFYWYMGKKIVEIQKDYKWGSKFLENLSKDLSKEFPDVKGFSYRNIRAIKQWYLFWQQLVAKMENSKWQQVVSQLFQIPWGHNLVIIQKCKNLDEAIFYVQNTIKHGISRSVLIHQIESGFEDRF